MRLCVLQTQVFHKQSHYEVDHRWYLHNQVGVSNELCILWLVISVASYICFFFITAIPAIQLFMSGWFWVFFFLENNTSGTGLLASWLISIFQLKAHFQIKDRSWLRTSALSSLSLTIVNRGVSSAKRFALHFNSFGRLLI